MGKLIHYTTIKPMEINKIYNEDCLVTMSKIEDNSINLIVADPPYGNLIDEEWDVRNGVTPELLSEFFRILEPSGSCYIFCGIGEKSNSLLENLNMISHTDFIFKDLITWKKQKGYGNRKGWLYTREEIIWLTKTKKAFWNEQNQYNLNEKRNYKRKIGKSWYKRFTNVWTDIRETLYEDLNADRLDGKWKENFNKKYKYLHQTIKPISIIERIVNAHTQEGDLVYDPFMGSGTTAIAASKNNRNFIGSEISIDHIELAKSRLRDLCLE